MVEAGPGTDKATPPSDWQAPTDGEIEEAADRITAGDAAGVLGEGVTTVSFVTDPALLPDEKLRFLFGYWQQLRDAHGERLGREHVDVLDMLPAVGNVMLLDTLRDGFDARYRVYGGGIAKFAGRDWTGSTVSEMNAVTRTSLALMYRACYRAVHRAGVPLYTQHDSPPWLAARSWRRLILPLFRPGGFLVGNLPVDIRYLDRRAQDLQSVILGRDGQA